MKSSLPALSTAVTCAPAAFASGMANAPEPPPPPLISTRAPGVASRCSLQRDRARLRDRRGLREAQRRGLSASTDSGAIANCANPPLRCRLSPYTSSPTREARDARARRGDDPGDVRSEHRAPAAFAARRTAHTRASRPALPVAEVQRGRGHFDEHLARPGHRHRHALEAEHVRRSIPVVHDRLHRRRHGPQRTALGDGRRGNPGFRVRRSRLRFCGMTGMLERLRDAMNSHDAARMASLFADDYESIQPSHPARGSAGALRCCRTGRRCSRACRTSPPSFWRHRVEANRVGRVGLARAHRTARRSR